MTDSIPDGSHELVIRFGRPFDIYVAGGYLSNISEIIVPFDGQEAADTAVAGTEVTARPWMRRAAGGALAFLRGQLSEKDAEIARLRAELDGLREVPVEYVTPGALKAAKAVPGREDGTILRETGGEKRAFAWRAAAGEWVQVP